MATGTTFGFIPQNDGNFIDEQYIKNPDKSKIISNPKIFDFRFWVLPTDW